MCNLNRSKLNLFCCRSNSRNRNSKRNVAKTKEAGSTVNLLQQPVSTTPPPSSTRRSVRHAAGATTGLASVAGATAASLGVNVVGKATTPSIENNGAAFKATARRKTRSSAALGMCRLLLVILQASE